MGFRFDGFLREAWGLYGAFSLQEEYRPPWAPPTRDCPKTLWARGKRCCAGGCGARPGNKYVITTKTLHSQPIPAPRGNIDPQPVRGHAEAQRDPIDVAVISKPPQRERRRREYDSRDHRGGDEVLAAHRGVPKQFAYPRTAVIRATRFRH